MRILQSPAPSEFVAYPLGTKTFFTVPPQDQPTNVALAEVAAEYADLAATHVDLGITACNTAGTLDECADGTPASPTACPNPTDENTVAASLAATWVEAFNLRIEAAEEMHDASLAVADGAYAENSNIADAAALGLTADHVSRGHAAHGWIGGAPGIMGMGSEVDAMGFCPDERLSAEASRALELIRQAGPPAGVVRIYPEGTGTTITLDALMTDFNGIAPGADSLRHRWSVLMEDPTIATLNSSQLYRRFGLSEQAFLDARAYLSHEVVMFGRDPWIVLPGDPLGGSETSETAFDLYAATRVPPTAPPAAYAAAIAAYRHEPTNLTVDNTWSSPALVPIALASGYRFSSSDTSLYDASSVAHISNIGDFVGAGLDRMTAHLATLGSVDAAAQALLAAHVGTLHPTSPGWLQVCVFMPKNTTNERSNAILDIRVAPAQDPDKLRIVYGRSGLECATRGEVEGAPCDLSEYLVPPATGYEWATHSGYVRVGVSADSVPRSLSVPEAAQVFVVREDGGDSAGDFVAVAGATIRLTTTATSSDVLYFQNTNTDRTYHCTMTAVAPEIFDRVAEAIIPDPGYCARPQAHCAGSPDLIPLENELTSDGDGVESSWRHYLNAARNAADEADRLGEEVIRTGLEMDLRAEQAIDDLEDICGVSININPVAAPPSPTSGSCPSGTCADTRYVCSEGTCVLDPVAYAQSLAVGADAARLADCLGGDTDVPFAALGNQHLCFWMTGSNRNTICEGAGANGRPACPWVVEATVDPATGEPILPPISQCSGTPGVPTTPGITFHVTERLSLFPMPNEGEAGADAGTTSDFELPCAAFARERAGRPVFGTKAATSAFFELSTFATLASQLGWRAQAGDVSHVTWNGSDIISTGGLDGTASLDWPFGAGSTTGLGALCPTGIERRTTTYGAPLDLPLSCIGNIVWTRESRAQVNDLLARAVMAARLVGGVGLGEVRVPYYPTAVDAGLTLGATDGVAGWEAGSPRLPLASGYFFQRSSTGAVIVHGSEFESYGRYHRTLMDFDAVAQRLFLSSGTTPSCPATTVDASVEWTNCPHDRSGCLEVFDDVPDGDDCSAPIGEFDRDMPMLVRRLAALDGSDPQTYVTRLWAREPAGAVRALVRNPSDTRTADRFFDARDGFRPTGDLAELTTYFRRSSCGDGSCGPEIERRFADCAHEGANCADVGCRGNDHDNYYGCDALGETEGVDFPSIRDGNRAFIGVRGLTRADVLNGVELLCYAALTAAPSVDPLTGVCGSDPPEVTRLADLVRVERFLTCQGNAIRSIGANTIVADLPRRVADSVAGGSPRVMGGSSGELAAQADEIAAAYTALRDAEINISLTLEGLATEIDLLNNAIEISSYTSQLQDLSMVSQTFDRVTSCAVAVARTAEVAGSSWLNYGGAVAGAAATCLNSAVQIGLAQRMRDVEGAIEEVNTESAFLRFDARVNELTSQMSREANAVNAALLRINAALSRLDGLRARGRRALARSLGMSSAITERHMAVDTVNHARYNTALVRYDEAHERAVRLAYIARVALEQRLGMTLDSMDEDLVTVAAPASWADEICNLPSIDYDAIRGGDLGTTGEREGDSASFLTPDGYSGAYVGDYVRRLEQVFESYNFAYPFQDGTDEVVLSLRDEIHGIRESCLVPGPNLLYQAGHLDRFEGTTAPGWVAENCAVLPNACLPGGPTACWPTAGEPRPPSCVVASPIEDEPGPIDIAASRTGRVPGYRLVFGSPSVDRDIPVGGATETWSGTTASTRFVQWVEAGPGIHRVSVFVRRTPMTDANGAYRIAPGAADFGTFLRVVRYVDSETEAELGLLEHSVTPEDYPDEWTRHYAFVDIPDRTWIGIVIDPNFEAVSGVRHSVLDVTGVMLENVSEAVGASVTPEIAADFEPGPFFDTTDVLTRLQPRCEDTDGSLFRDRSFNYGCVRVCPDGYDGSCIAAESETRCFWETSFSANSDVLERLTGRTSAGFAAGSYNYRIERIAVNLVGTNLRDCEGLGAGTPSTCYAAGTTAYSLLHTGPFLVRNARGELYSAPLFNGRIENADALAMERYLTNPLSSADRSIVDAETSIELRGRPLGGTLMLRIWDDAAFRFDRLEDVQIVLGYRYWTRQR